MSIDFNELRQQSTGAPKEPPTELNPQTNLPGAPARSTMPLDITELTIRPGARAISTFETPYRDLEKYSEYGVGLSPYADLDERRAVNQSTGEKWGRGLMKAGVTTLGAVAENTIGILAGLGELATGGQYYDNFVGKAVDSANESMREAFPNYYTRAEMSPDRSLWDSMGTANFWADKVANGLGYTLGSIATMFLTGGTGPILGTAAKLAKGGQLINTASRVARLSRAGKLGQLAQRSGKSLDALSRTARITRGAQMMEAGAMMSLAEASVEARETKKMALDNLIAKEIELNPAVSSKADISVERLRELENAAIGAGNTAFGLNMAVLSATNIGMFGHMMRPGMQVAKKLPLVYSREAGEAVVKRLGQNAPGWLQKTGRVAGTLSPLAKNSAIEGIQEGSQFASNKAAILLAESKVFDGGTLDMVEALSEGFSETYGTAEGIEQTAIGVIVGALGGGGAAIRGVKARKEEQERIDRVLELMSNDPLQDALNLIEDNEVRSKIVAQMDEALKSGNTRTYNSLRDQLMANLVNFHVNHGSFQAFKEQVKSVGDLSEEEFKKFFNMEGVELKDVGINSPSEYANDLVKKIEIAEKRKRQIEDVFPNPMAQPKSLRRALEGEGGKQARQAQSLSQELLKSKLYTMAVQADFAADRRDSLAADILQESEAQLNRYASSTAGPISKEDLNQLTIDLFGKEGELAKAQKAFEAAVEALTKNPSQENVQAYVEALQKRQTLVDDRVNKFIQEKTGLTQGTNALDWTSLSTKVSDYIGLSISELEANETLSELLNDPQQREVFREQLDKAREAKQKARQDAREKKNIEKAKTEEDLDKTQATSAETQAQKRAKQKEIREQKKELKAKFETMTDEELAEYKPEGALEQEVYEKASEGRVNRQAKFVEKVAAVKQAFDEYNAALQTKDPTTIHKAAANVLAKIHQVEQNYIRAYPSQVGEYDQAALQELDRFKQLMATEGYTMGGAESAADIDYSQTQGSEAEYQITKTQSTSQDEFKTEDGSPVVSYLVARPTIYTDPTGAVEQVIVPGAVHVKQYREKEQPKENKKAADPNKKKTKAPAFKEGDRVIIKGSKVQGTVQEKSGKLFKVERDDGVIKKYNPADLALISEEPSASTTAAQTTSPLAQYIGQEVTLARKVKAGDKGTKAVVIGVDPKNPETKLTVEFEDGTRGTYGLSTLGIEKYSPKTAAQTKEDGIRKLQALADENSRKIKLSEDGSTYVNAETGQVYERATQYTDPSTDPAMTLLNELQQQNLIEIKNGKFAIDARKLNSEQKAQLKAVGGKEAILRIHSAAIVGNNMDQIMRDFFAGKEMKYEDYKRCE